MTENEISRVVVEASVAVHRELEPGLLEIVYERSLAHELEDRGLKFVRQVAIPIRYKDLEFDEGFRADIIVNDLVILGLKSVTQISPAHRKQIQIYIRLSDRKLGILLNFGAALMSDGIVRAVNGLEE